jgi:hypothetical protein
MDQFSTGVTTTMGIPPEAYPTTGLTMSRIPVEKMARFREELARVTSGGFRDLKRVAKPDLEITLEERLMVVAGLRVDLDKREVCSLIVQHRGLYPTMPRALLQHFNGYFDCVYLEIRRQNSVAQLQALNRKHDSPEFKAQALDLLQVILGIKIEGVLRYQSEPPAYEILTASGKTASIKTTALCSCRKMTTILADITHHHIPQLDKSAWQEVAQAILHLAENVDVGAEVTRQGEVSWWFTEYFRECAPKPLGKDGRIEDRIADRRPYIKDGTTYFFLRELYLWLLQTGKTRLPFGTYVNELKSHGCTRQTEHYKEADGSSNSTTVWRITDNG